MKTIYKYPLGAQLENLLTLRGKVLCAGVQGDDILVWAVHDDEAPERKVQVTIVGTGHELEVPESSFVNTVFLGMFVFHIFAEEQA